MHPCRNRWDDKTRTHLCHTADYHTGMSCMQAYTLNYTSLRNFLVICNPSYYIVVVEMYRASLKKIYPISAEGREPVSLCSLCRPPFFVFVSISTTKIIPFYYIYIRIELKHNFSLCFYFVTRGTNERGRTDARDGIESPRATRSSPRNNVCCWGKQPGRP